MRMQRMDWWNFVKKVLMGVCKVLWKMQGWLMREEAVKRIEWCCVTHGVVKDLFVFA